MSTWLSLLRELGLVSPVEPAAKPVTATMTPSAVLPVSSDAFEPADLLAIQAAFDQACAARNAHTATHRGAIATVLFEAWKAGERDPKKLLDAAMAAAL